VRIGNGFTAVLTATGRVWTFGSGRTGQLGTGVMFTDALPPQLLEGHISQFKIVQLSCGGVHTIALTETGRLFSWGLNSEGQLGHGDTNHRSIPTMIEGEVWMDQGKTFTFSEEKVVFVSSNTSCNAVVTDKSEIWVWGSKYPLWCGQETINNFLVGKFLLYPRPMRPVTNMEKVSVVACGGTLTVALNTNKSARGEIWVWGRTKATCRHLASPVGDGSWNEAFVPTLIGGELVRHSVTSVSCGDYHVCALTEEGLVFTWGRGTVHSYHRPTIMIQHKFGPVIGCHGQGEEDVLSPKLLTKSDLTPLPPVGRCRPLCLQKTLAFAMSSHQRLGSNSSGEIVDGSNLNMIRFTRKFTKIRKLTF
jgi:alpha-tubulin suppressor-like RCC1 family protein